MSISINDADNGPYTKHYYDKKDFDSDVDTLNDLGLGPFRKTFKEIYQGYCVGEFQFNCEGDRATATLYLLRCR